MFSEKIKMGKKKSKKKKLLKTNRFYLLKKDLLPSWLLTTSDQIMSINPILTFLPPLLLQTAPVIAFILPFFFFLLIH